MSPEPKPDNSASLEASPPPTAVVVEFGSKGVELSPVPSSSDGSSPTTTAKKSHRELEERSLSSSTAATLRTAEETWFSEYCDADFLTLSSSSSSSSSPKEASSAVIGKTIDLPKPVRRHRRNNSAVPRLQSSPGERPPLPPKRPSAAGSHRKHALSWDSSAFPHAPKSSSHSLVAKPTHRRTSSSPCIDVSKVFSPLDNLVDKLEKMQEQFGKHDAKVAPVWNMIGNTKFRDGDNEAAVEAYKAAIKCEPGPQLAESYGNLATVLFAMNRLDEAVRLFVNARDVLEYNALAAGKDPNSCLKIATVQYQLGLAQTMRKHYDEAWLALKHSCKIRASVLGEKHQDMAKGLDAIGKVYLLRGNHKAALACHEEALSIKKSLPTDNATKARGILVSLQNIAAAQKARKDTNAAIMAYGAVLGAQKKQISTGLVSAKAEAAETLVQLADLFEERNMQDKADSYLGEADVLLEEMGFSKGSPLRAAVTQRISSNKEERQ